MTSITPEYVVQLIQDIDRDKPVEVIEHAPVANANEYLQALEMAGKSKDDCLPLKNLFLKNKKDEFILVTALATTEISLKVLEKALNMGSGLRFASNELLQKVLGVTPGSVSPLCLAHNQQISAPDGKNTKLRVTFVMDAKCVNAGVPLAIHPLISTRSVIVPAPRIVAFAEGLGYGVETIDFGAAPGGTEGRRGGGETKLGLSVRKAGDFAQWYAEALTKGEMIEYYDVSGCYVLRPWAYAMWEGVRGFLDPRVRRMGAERAYFPLFVSEGALGREREHIAGFAPEVAWVTRAGRSALEQPVAVRPTSEAAIYPAFARWVRSHRDLPARVSQWCGVVRWEFSHPVPLIRAREFLWQEGHGAYRTEAEADAETLRALDLYRRVYEELLAVPCTKGRKTAKEKFAGAQYTTTVETFVTDAGRGCQGATSHQLGQKFGEMFGIRVEDAGGSMRTVWQNSWGISTRCIGIMVMTHGDNKGLVLPPRIAPTQVIIIPCGITSKTTEEETGRIYSTISTIESILTNTQEAADTPEDKDSYLEVHNKAIIRAKSDTRSFYTPGWRYNYWELKGVPLRIEIGPNEVNKFAMTLSVRHSGCKKLVYCYKEASSPAIDPEHVLSIIQSELQTIHYEMLNKAKQRRDKHTKVICDWKEFNIHLNNKCMMLSPWCGSEDCEDNIKLESSKASKVIVEEKAPSMGAKSLCIPYQYQKLIDDYNKGSNESIEYNVSKYKCISPSCTKSASYWTLFGRSY